MRTTLTPTRLKVDRKTFFGVNADIKYLGNWLDVFVSRVERWTSPKYLIGESYGTTRVSGLALELQEVRSPRLAVLGPAAQPQTLISLSHRPAYFI